MAQLKVSGEFYALSRGNIAIRHENHVRNGSAGEDCATDELAD